MVGLRSLGCTLFSYALLVLALTVLRLALLVLSVPTLRRVTGWLTSLPLSCNPFLHIRTSLRLDPAACAGARRVIFMATHKSNIDPFVLVGAVQSACPFLDVGSMKVVYKSALHDLPALGPLLRALQWIPVDFATLGVEDLRVLPESSREVKRLCVAALEEGSSLVVFPEGRRHPEGVVGEFKPFMFSLAQSLGVPILPATLVGTGDAMTLASNWLHPAEIRVTLHPLVFPIEGEEPAAFAARVRAILGGT